MQRRILAASAMTIGGAAIAVAAGLTSGGSSTASSPVPQALPTVSSTAPVAPASSPAAPSPAAPSIPVVPAPAVRPHPLPHANSTPRTTHSTHTSQTGRAPSDAVRDRVYQQPLNARPEGQSSCCQPGTKSPATGASDSPITTPTPLPNPATGRP